MPAPATLASMFIRRTQTHATSTGGAYFIHCLVRSERIGHKVRQRTLLNLGRHFNGFKWTVIARPLSLR